MPTLENPIGFYICWQVQFYEFLTFSSLSIIKYCFQTSSCPSLLFVWYFGDSISLLTCPESSHLDLMYGFMLSLIACCFAMFSFYHFGGLLFSQENWNRSGSCGEGIVGKIEKGEKGKAAGGISSMREEWKK